MGKVYKLSRVLQTDRSAMFTEKNNFEHLKDGASEGFPLSFLTSFQNSMIMDSFIDGVLGLHGGLHVC